MGVFFLVSEAHVARRWLVVAMVLVAGASWSAERAGVKLDDRKTQDGKELVLNGLGVRTKFIISVYVAGLYLEHPSKDPNVILKTDEVRRVDLRMLRDLDKKTIIEAIKVGIEANSSDKGASVNARLEKLIVDINDVKKGQTFSIVYVPGKGTWIDGNSSAYIAEGKDFADALFSVWLGSRPADEGLKKGMLGS